MLYETERMNYVVVEVVWSPGKNGRKLNLKKYMSQMDAVGVKERLPIKWD